MELSTDFADFLRLADAEFEPRMNTNGHEWLTQRSPTTDYADFSDWLTQRPPTTDFTLQISQITQIGYRVASPPLLGRPGEAIIALMGFPLLWGAEGGLWAVVLRADRPRPYRFRPQPFGKRDINDDAKGNRELGQRSSEYQ